MEHPLEAGVPWGYAEFEPPADLAGRVVCVWTRRGIVGEGSGHRVLPDGCADILFAFNSTVDHEEYPAATLVGPMTKPLITSPTQARLHVGIRFAPGFAFAVTGTAAHETTDCLVPYSEAFQDESARLDAFKDARTDAARVSTAFDVARKRMAFGQGVPRSVLAALRRITATDGRVRVAALASELGLARQHLARQFAVHVGVNPKLFARIVRAHAAIARAAARGGRDRRDQVPAHWGAIAHGLGYCDQPHFVDDFKGITGLTPGEWAQACGPTTRPLSSSQKANTVSNSRMRRVKFSRVQAEHRAASRGSRSDR